jgi:hypothetical protein
MTNREAFVAAFAQTLAPKLFALCGRKPEEMGFPIYDTEAEVNDHLEQQFSPVEYWTNKATQIAEGLATAFEAGGVDLSVFDYDAAVEAFRALRDDLVEEDA